MDRGMGSIDTRLERLAGNLRVLTWMAGFNLAMTAGILWRLLSH